MRYCFICCLILICTRNHAQTLSGFAKTADSLCTVGTNLFKQGKSQESASALEAARSAALKATPLDSVMYASILHYLGTDYTNLSRTLEGVELLFGALAIRKRALDPNHPECGKTLNNLAYGLKNLGRLDEAEHFAIEALRNKEGNTGRNTMEYSNSQNALAQIMQAQGQYDRADSVISELVATRKALAGDKSIPYANALNLWAGNKTRQFRLEEAEQDFVKALSIMEAQKGGSSKEYLSVLQNLGQHYLNMGQLERADSTQRVAVLLAAQLFGNTSLEYAFALGNLGFILNQYGRFLEALPILEQSINLYESKSEPNNYEILRTMGNLATCHYYKGDFDKAAAMLKKNADTFDKMPFRNQEYYLAQQAYGLVLYHRKSYGAAEGYLLKAGASPLQKQEYFHHNLGLLYMAWGKLDSAEQSFLRALAIAEKRPSHFLLPKNVTLYFRILELYHLKQDYAKTLRYAQKGQEQLEQASTQAIYALSEKELEEAITFAFSRHYALFKAAIQWNKPELNAVCYDNLLLTKGFLLENAVQRRKTFEQNGAASPEKWRQWKALKRKIAAEWAKTEPDVASMDVWEKQANALEKALAGSIDAHPLATWRAVQNALGPREAAVEFVRLSDEALPYYAAFVLTKDAPYPVCVALCPEDSLPPMFDKKRNPVVSYYGANGNQVLYHLVFEPLLPHLKGVQKVWYAPHGLLHFVNFPALAASKGQILAQTFDLTLLGSTKQVIGRQRTTAAVPATALLLGDMDYGPQDQQTSARGNRGGWPSKQWPRLKGARREIEDAARLLKAKGTRVETLMDTAANERAVRQHLSRKKAPSVLHFATHAFYMQDTNFTFVDLLDNSNPIGKTNPLQRAGIVMAGGNDAANPKRRAADDGILSTQEVALLELSGTQLAILSACDSGLGDLDPQEGVWGLQRAFRTAGAQNIISSLWKTNDDAAANFMNDFYHYWLVQGKDIHDAFHAAREASRAFNPDPKYWACFILAE